jgi:hypothetical protein
MGVGVVDLALQSQRKRAAHHLATAAAAAADLAGAPLGEGGGTRIRCGITIRTSIYNGLTAFWSQSASSSP